jgi:DnaJ-class molecular chaperone
MNLYSRLLALIVKYKCETCQGSGIITDAEPGDIYFNTQTCSACKGTGVTKTIQQIAALIRRLL